MSKNQTVSSKETNLTFSSPSDTHVFKLTIAETLTEALQSPDFEALILAYRELEETYEKTSVNPNLTETYKLDSEASTKFQKTLSVAMLKAIKNGDIACDMHDLVSILNG